MMRANVKIPTTPAAIQAPCQSGSEVSFTLVIFLLKPKPEILDVPHDVSATSEKPETNIFAEDFQNPVIRINRIGK
jgi:hypothetical protein